MSGPALDVKLGTPESPKNTVRTCGNAWRSRRSNNDRIAQLCLAASMSDGRTYLTSVRRQH